MCLWLVVVCLYLFFVFFRQKTAYEMRISDWSSDVCSSDLVRTRSGRATSVVISASPCLSRVPLFGRCPPECFHQAASAPAWQGVRCAAQQIGRASCRERVCQYV